VQQPKIRKIRQADSEAEDYDERKEKAKKRKIIKEIQKVK